MTPRDATPRLGRGLAALFGDAPGSASQTGQARTTLSVTALAPGPFQPRTAVDLASLEELTKSIKQQGILQPILVRPHPSVFEQYEIIAGERRWRAAQAAGLHEVPVLIRSLSDTEAMAAALVENLQRQDLDPIEEAEGYARLTNEFGLTQDQLGELVGKSRSHVANTIRLLQLSPTLRAHVKSGALTAGHARALLTHPDQDTAAKAVIARGLNVRQTETFAKQVVQGPRVKTELSVEDSDMAAVEQELSAHLGLRVRITRRGQGGTLQLDYHTLDQLDVVVQLLNGA